ncbi:helix-turn-helix domain-containing protein [Flavobacterium sp. 5]|uniref:AraC family transcriptional regulator n=1 Tax=Flavobacterium sp. 5 TaxID=2035199 RepID=UPI000C2BB98C|nr:helix-turn-helix transcriptional regulator [Flavobacterium sp. 5]PKB17741.1 AraC family transcriptional regulator [Flavobacterium sp. 5]
MNNDYKTIIKIDLGFEVNKSRPITTYSEIIQNARCQDSHSHPRAQIISCDSGIMEVVTKNNIWIVNPTQSVWIPSNVDHQVYFPSNVKIITAFIDPSQLEKLPTSSFAFDNSNFLKSLLLKVVSFANPTEFSPEQEKIMEVLLDEISVLQPTSAFLPTSKDERIKKVTDTLLKNLSSKQTIEHYAGLSCVSSKTLSRLFIKELGMSFGDWKIRLKLLEAIKQLGEKKSITEIALNLGYENPSSFITTFKKHFGKTPSNYVLEENSKIQHNI